MHLAEAEHLQNNAFEFKSGIYRTERANLGQTEIFWLSYYVKKCTFWHWSKYKILLELF